MKKRLAFAYIAIVSLLNTVCLAAVSEAEANAKIDGVIGWIGGACKLVGGVGFVFGAIQLVMAFSNDDPDYKQRSYYLLAGSLVLFNAETIILAVSKMPWF